MITAEETCSVHMRVVCTMLRSAVRASACSDVSSIVQERNGKGGRQGRDVVGLEWCKEPCGAVLCCAGVNLRHD
jgi:hypothetical protein